MSPATVDRVWSERDTRPDAVEAAVRRLVTEAHSEDNGFVPGRVLNLVCLVDHDYSGEVANRLRRVGRYHASRTIVCSITPGRETIDATVSIAAATHEQHGEFSLTRETVVVELGTRHLRGLDGVVDPLVITDLPTVVWAPHGHRAAVDRLLGLAQVVLMDATDDDPEDALARARTLGEAVYVVDLAWLRSTPWRERIAATFDPPARRAELRDIGAVVVRHHPASEAAGMLLVGWLASRLEWTLGKLSRRGASLVGVARDAAGASVDVVLEAAPQLQVRGLEGVTLRTRAERSIAFDRGPGGLHATTRAADGHERSWTILGASRGEGGVLGEGIRQALLRDPTYAPALAAATELVPR